MCGGSQECGAEAGRDADQEFAHLICRLHERRARGTRHFLRFAARSLCNQVVSAVRPASVHATRRRTIRHGVPASLRAAGTVCIQWSKSLLCRRSWAELCRQGVPLPERRTARSEEALGRGRSMGPTKRWRRVAEAFGLCARLWTRRRLPLQSSPHEYGISATSEVPATKAEHSASATPQSPELFL